MTMMYRVTAEGMNENGQAWKHERLVSKVLVDGFRSELSERKKIIEMAFREDVDFYSFAEALGLVKITIVNKPEKE